MTYFKKGITRAFDFSGRSARKEFWRFFLFAAFLIPLLLGLIDGVTGMVDKDTGVGLLGGVYSLLSFIPLLSACVRRLHDTNRSGWFILAPYVIGFFIGWIVTLIIDSDMGLIVGLCFFAIAQITVFCYLVFDSDPNKNKFGLNPKETVTSNHIPKDKSDKPDKVVIAEPLTMATISNGTKPINDDSEFYLQATQETDDDNENPALWAKAMAICEGDEGKAKYKYINFRVEELTNAAKQGATLPSIQISSPEHESKDTDAELSVLFLKEKGFKVTYKDGKWVFIDASGNGREFSTRGLVALANLKGDFHSFKEKKLAEINAHPEETPETKTHKEFSGDTQKQAQDAKKAINKLFDDATNTVVKGVSDKFNKS